MNTTETSQNFFENPNHFIIILFMVFASIMVVLIIYLCYHDCVRCAEREWTMKNMERENKINFDNEFKEITTDIIL